MDLSNFDWGNSNEWYIKEITGEFVVKNLYQRYFEVEEGDIVVDLGSSIGPFPYTIKEKQPKHVYCVEPSEEQILTLTQNLKEIPSTIIPYGLGSKDGIEDFKVYGNKINTKSSPSISFDTLISKYNITSIDFLKTDCEGGEYNFFTNENIWWIKNNVKKIVGEWHLSTPKLKQQFRVFRDTYLRLFPNHEIISVDGITKIKWDLWNEHFIEYYNEVIIYINNKK